jgi:uroporphyrinogen-III synthase
MSEPIPYSVLSGRRIVITRPPGQADALARLLAAHGAEPVFYPAVTIGPPHRPAALAAHWAAAAEGRFAWVVLTSANAIAWLPAHTLPAGVRVAAVGAGTAAAAQAAFGRPPTLVPAHASGAALAAALPDAEGTAVLVLHGADAPPSLADALRARGAHVTTAEAYTTGPGTGGADLPRLAAAGVLDALTFTSAGTVEGCFARYAAEGGDPAHLARLPIAAMGESSARALAAHGLKGVAMAHENTLTALVSAVAALFTRPGLR